MSTREVFTRLGSRAALLTFLIVQSPLALSGNVSVLLGAQTKSENCSLNDNFFPIDAAEFVSLSRSGPLRNYADCNLRLKMDGEINKETIDTLIAAVDMLLGAYKQGSLQLNVDSPGGDVWEAFRFAKHVRRSGYSTLQVVVGTNSACSSACVYILAGGYERAVKGTIGIHHPYLTSERAASLGYNDTKSAYDALYAEVEAFFQAVNISDRLVSDMWRVPSHRLRVLSADEVESYGLNQRDSVYQEMRNAKLRAACGPGGPAAYEDLINTVNARCKGQTDSALQDCATAIAMRHPICHCWLQMYPSEFECSSD